MFNILIRLLLYAYAPVSLSGIAEHALLNDVIGALSLGKAPTIATSLLDLPVDNPPTSLTCVQQCLTSSSKSKVSTYTERRASLELLLILNQTIICGAILYPLQNGSPEQRISSTTQRMEWQRSHRRNLCAISAWKAQYWCFSPPSLKVLFHLAELHIAIPDLHTLLREVGYIHTQGPCQSRIGTGITKDIIHTCWLLLESVSECEDFTCVWLPISTFMAALCLWRDIKSQGSSRAHGSIKVLQVFQTELRKMPWPCCSEMIGILDSLD